MEKNQIVYSISNDDKINMMSAPNDERKRPCPILNKFCEYYLRQDASSYEATVEFCSHPSNPKHDHEGSCRQALCPVFLAETQSKQRLRSGMYGETERVKMGKFTICRQSPDCGDNSVWIENGDGEGAAFEDSLLEPVIKNFFDTHF